MSFEKSVVLTFGAALAVSSVMAVARSEEEFSRRRGLNGTQLLRDQHGKNIEFVLSKPRVDETRPILVLENGLGSPLESWDWIDYLLADHFDILRYHRRGYALTKSRLRPAAMLEKLLRKHAPHGRVTIASHSLGALVSANVLGESPYIRNRTRSVFIVDGTDASLLKEDRESPQRVARFQQIMMQEILGSVTGVNRWVTSRLERDVEYRPDIQRSFLVTTAAVRTQLSALREYLKEPADTQDRLRSLPIRRHVVAAADNVEQQQTLAERLSASFTVVPDSSHRSVIGKLRCAHTVAEAIRKDAYEV